MPLHLNARNACHDLAGRARDAHPDRDVYLLIRGESDYSLTCRMADGRYVTFNDAVKELNGRFNKGEKFIAIVQGMATGSNISG